MVSTRITKPPKPKRENLEAPKTPQQSALAREGLLFQNAGQQKPVPKAETPTEKPKGKGTVEVLPGGSAELGRIEHAFSVAQQQGIQPGTPKAEALFTPQKTVEQKRQEVAQLTPSEQSQQSLPPTVNLDTPNGIINPTTLATNLPSVIAGATALGTAGATGGALLGGPVGAVIGGAVGAVIGGASAYLVKLSTDRRQITRDAFQLYQSSKLSDGDVLQFAKDKTFSPDQVMMIYEVNLANTLESQRALRALTKGKVGKDLSGAMDELIEVNEYLRQEPIRRQQILIALQS